MWHSSSFVARASPVWQGWQIGGLGLAWLYLSTWAVLSWREESWVGSFITPSKRKAPVVYSSTYSDPAELTQFSVLYFNKSKYIDGWGWRQMSKWEHTDSADRHRQERKERPDCSMNIWIRPHEELTDSKTMWQHHTLSKDFIESPPFETFKANVG